MDGLDTMCKAELVLLCEKHKLTVGKTVSQMRYTLRKFFEENDDDPSAKKLKKDDSATKSGVCKLGASCPQLHSLSHRLAFSHDGFRPNPIKCRDGMGCAKLHDKDHLTKYAHEDDLTKVCKDGADCPKLHLIDHRREFEHPGFRAEPVLCRDGMSCSLLHDKRHLYKYAHAGPSDDGAAAAPTPATPATPAPASPAKPVVVKAAVSTKKLEDVPLDSAPESTLAPIDKDSEEFWDLEEKFAANLQGRNEDYVEKRIKAGKKPLRFVLIGAEKVSNPVLEERFELKKQEMKENGRDSKELRERVSFHGTHPKNLKSILRYSLLRFKHPLNPCKTQSDDGYFGTNKKGIYVSRYADYTLKYSNRVCAVDAGDEVKTVMFRTLPGKSKYIEKMCGGIEPHAGHDSHSSPTYLEWYLFDEAQVCPQYVLKIRAMEDTRTAADDE